MISRLKFTNASRCGILGLCLVVWFNQLGPAQAQSRKDKSAEVSTKFIGELEPNVQYWKVGAVVKGGERPCKNLLMTIPVPSDWPEQTVSVYSQNIPDAVNRAKFREGTGGLKQWILTIPTLNAGETLLVETIYAVRVAKIQKPATPQQFVIPKVVPRELKIYLEDSPGIDHRSVAVKNKAKELTAEHEAAWDKVHAIYDWLGNTIQLTHEPMGDIEMCLDKLAGPSEDITALFVGMCRSLKIPARMVWVDNTEYAEFYLQDEDKVGYWFPVQVVGIREFGERQQTQIILQKGDNHRVPEKPDPLRYVMETLKGTGAPGGCQFIQARVAKPDP